MTTNSGCRCGQAIVLALLALGLGGCQPFANTVDKFNASLAVWRRPSPTNASVLSTTPTAPLTPQQKADVEMAVALTLENQGKTEQAIRSYQNVLKKDKRRADAQHRLAVLYDQKSDFAAAKKHYEAALKQMPKNAELHCDYGYHCYLQQRWPESEAALRKALALDSNSPRAHNNLGLLLARRGNEKEALAEFAKAGCSQAECHANLAFGLAAENHWSQANLHFQRALSLDPNCAMAKNGMTVMQSVTQGHGQSANAPVQQFGDGALAATAPFGARN